MSPLLLGLRADGLTGHEPEQSAEERIGNHLECVDDTSGGAKLAGSRVILPPGECEDAQTLINDGQRHQ